MHTAFQNTRFCDVSQSTIILLQLFANVNDIFAKIHILEDMHKKGDGNMSEIYERIETLCNGKGLNITQMCSEKSKKTEKE